MERRVHLRSAMPAPTPRPWPIVALLATLGGCDAATGDPDDELRAVPMALHAEDDADPRRCEAIADEASDFLDSAMTCSDDLDCEAELGTVVSDEPCLPQLSCWLAVSTHERVELDAVLDRLQVLDAEYREACDACPVPTCVDPDLVHATCERRACALGVATPPDIASLTSTLPR
jgi:hypothetical protein